jgi:hypothetical protein
MSETQYFAAKEGKETANIVLQKANTWFNGLNSNGYLDQLRTMYAAYYGAYYTDTGNANSITFGGEQGELVQLAVNHLNNLALHMLNMITSVRPTMQARSVNTDYKSMTQTKLANGVLDYYMREKRLETYIKKACEMAIVLGSGYVKLEWNSTSGEVHDFDEDLQTDIYEGDIEVSNLSPFDVIFDVSREDQKHDWILTRSFKNKYDVAAKFPEYAREIQQLETKSQVNSFYLDSFYGDDTDLIPVYEFYHKRTESMPKGRYLMFVSDTTVLLDSPMPYRNLPIYRIAPSDIMGTPFGYSPLFGILPIQDAVNSLHSTVLTNQSAFGVQSIVVPRGGGVDISELSSGLNMIEADETNGQIRPLNLTQTPKEIFDYIQMLEKSMETISGVNAVARGNPDPNLRSGNALALVQSMTLQFMSGLQQSYVALIEDLGTGLINILKDYATVPRVAAIVGKTNRTYMKEFTGDDLSSINRVIVEVGNALARTTAGRVEMAEQLLQMGLIKTPQQYFSVMNTGNLDVMTEDEQAQLFLVKGENEYLVEGKPVTALFIDDHQLHINEHGAVLSDPEMRLNPEVIARTLAHIQEHIDLLRGSRQTEFGPQANADYLQIVGQQPLAPLGGSPIGQPPMQQPPVQSMDGQQIPQMLDPAQQLDPMSLQQGMSLPQPAQPPAVNGIPQPTTPEQMMMQSQGGVTVGS